MAFPYDPTATNSALQKLGQDYQLPTSMDSMTGAGAFSSTTPAAGQSAISSMTAAKPPAMTPANPAPTAPVATTNDPGAPEPEKKEGGTSGVQQAGQVIEGISKVGGADERSNKAFQKVGALVGTILSAYTGNAAGVAGGVSAMKQAQD